MTSAQAIFASALPCRKHVLRLRCQPGVLGAPQGSKVLEFSAHGSSGGVHTSCAARAGTRLAHRLRPCRPAHSRPSLVTRAAYDPLAALGTDFLTFLGATVLVVPVFKAAKQSPVLGYLFAGAVMGQLGLFRNVNEIEKLSELGVLFLLFEMGLELSLDKLRALFPYAFGLGSLQMVLTTMSFMAVSLPPGEGLMTRVLEDVMGAPPWLAELGSVDEALTIAVALSLSSSAFVLQLLKERGELETKFGQATLGILLFQDIATVPFLVLLPLIEGSGDATMPGLDGAALAMQLAPTALKTFAGLGLLLLGGRTLLRRVFEVVAAARSSEVFIALVLLSVAGASLLTEKLGFSDTLGAFVSGVLLAETNFKAQVEADIQPFRGLLLGLFFVTTGASLDVGLLIREWPTVLGLLVGLIALKASLITAIAPVVGLSRADGIRTGFVLSQGGEFAFVLLALAAQLNVLPTELNKLLIIVVVLSMAATPALTEAGKRVADYVQARWDGPALTRTQDGVSTPNPVVICGFGDVGQAVANMLDVLGVPFVAFDLTVPRVEAAQAAGFNVLYGDGSRSKVLQAAGVVRPRAIAVAYTARGRAIAAVSTLRTAFPAVPILARAIDLRHAGELEEAGATQVVSAESEAGVAIGSRLALELGSPPGPVAALAQAMRDDMATRVHQLAESSPPPPSLLPPESPALAAAKTVYTFEGDRVSVLGKITSATGSVGSVDDDAASSGILANLAGSLLTAIGSEGAGRGSPAGQSSLDGVALHAEDGASSSGTVGEALVTISREGESVTLPDGSLECPVGWGPGDGESDAVAASNGSADAGGA